MAKLLLEHAAFDIDDTFPSYQLNDEISRDEFKLHIHGTKIACASRWYAFHRFRSNHLAKIFRYSRVAFFKTLCLEYYVIRHHYTSKLKQLRLKLCNSFTAISVLHRLILRRINVALSFRRYDLWSISHSK